MALTLRRTKLYDFLDMTGSAAPSVGMASCVEIPVFGNERFKCSASTALPPPNAIAQLATGVNPLVLKVGDKLQV